MNKGTSLYAPFELREHLQRIGGQERRNIVDTLRYLVALYEGTTPVQRAEILMRVEGEPTYREVTA